MKQRIRLSESDLHRIVKESIQKILRENDEYDFYDENIEMELKKRYPKFVDLVLRNPNNAFYYWVVETDNGVIYSPTCFRSEDEAADDCDAKMKSDDYSGYVESFFAENGNIISDTMLCHEDGFWMD